MLIYSKIMNEQTTFLMLYSFISAYFSKKMIRLVLLLAPPACICAAYAMVKGSIWSYNLLQNDMRENILFEKIKKADDKDSKIEYDALVKLREGKLFSYQLP